MYVHTIVSGGNNGCDLGALLAAKDLHLNTNGYLPSDLKCDDGRGEERLQEFGLQISTGGFRQRDMDTADLCDGLVAFLLDRPMTGKGTTGTINYVTNGEHKFDGCPVKPPDRSYQVIEGKKPALLLWDIPFSGASNLIKDFICRFNIEVLMISGPVEMTHEGITETCRTVIREALLQHQ
jgi:hypothetical protein